MLHYVIDGFFPSIASSFPPTASLSPAQEEMKFQAFYDEVAVSTARMVAKWQVRWEVDRMCMIHMTTSLELEYALSE